MAIAFYVAQNLVNILTIPRGLTARIAGFHPAGPGSTPGVGIRIFLFRTESRHYFITKDVENLQRVITKYLNEYNRLKSF